MTETLLILIYILLIALLVVGIILGVKLIFTLDKLDELLDDVTEKVKSLDKVFEVTELISGRMSSIVETVIGFASNSIKKIFKHSNKKIEEEEDDE